MRVLPSRKILQGWPHTPFRTDEQDKENGVWDKVFLNLTDFGNFFACGSKGTPNPYGPILLVFSPEVLRGAIDVGICLDSAGAAGFDRQGSALCLKDVPRLFQNEKPDWLKPDLATEFCRSQYTASPEISVSAKGDSLSLDHLEKIIVDPYALARSLTKITSLTVKRLAENIKVVERIYRKGDRQELVMELAKFLSFYVPPVKSYKVLMINSPDVSEEMKTWLNSLNPRASKAFEDFATYLTLGSLSFIE